VQWKDDYLVGIDEIDEQHKALFKAASNIIAALQQRQNWLEVHCAMVRLLESAKIHFAVEESLMRLCKYPGLNGHRQEHHEFADKLMGLQRESLTDDVSFWMAAFIRKWLHEHIHNSDKRFAAFVLEVTAIGGKKNAGKRDGRLAAAFQQRKRPPGPERGSGDGGVDSLSC